MSECRLVAVISCDRSVSGNHDVATPVGHDGLLGGYNVPTISCDRCISGHREVGTSVGHDRLLGGYNIPGRWSIEVWAQGDGKKIVRQLEQRS